MLLPVSRDRRTRVGAAVALTVLLAGCSTPPGPDPATPAPRLPPDAIAYDDLLSTDREFPFAADCSQITPEVVAAVEGRGAVDLPGVGSPPGCSIQVGSDTLDELWILPEPPPNPSEPRYFPLAWNARLEGTTYHRRLLIDERYYAVETIDFLGGLPGCYLRVDTGSPVALLFRGVLPEAHGLSYGELNPAVTAYVTDREGTDRFMAENCPVVERMAVPLLAAIDPGGGSLGAP
ncbi:DUF3558 domain-containing protein [Pseudonocardia lacus]|uniref:DUF3558 domain-containing protein n=1 Tax=Pseudonocardia lacus TaxID=2835865 RepID=UPI001BDD486A|nr:DUF3558 domain-containing protein [Pseudonocardia lacus]